jgi:hypothetical protein
MYKRMLAVGIVMMVILFAVSAPGQAAPQLQARSVVAYPTDGAVVGGVVDVTGTATHPNLERYELFYATGPQPTGDTQWIAIAIVEGTQVDNSVLGTWNTTVIPDGQYTMALAVWGANDPAAQPLLFFVRNLTVNNAVPVEESTEEPPTPEPLPTAVPATVTPVTIEQPPTPTSPPTSTPGGEGEETEETNTSLGEGDEGFSLPIDFTELRTAFLSGGKIAFFLFGMWALYLFVKALIRWLLRQSWRAPWK